MSTSYNEAAGLGIFIELDGIRYQAAPLLPEDLEAAREWLKSKTPNPLDLLKGQIEGLPEHVQTALANKAYDAYEKWGSLNTVQGHTWANSLDGLAFFFWRSVKKAHPEVTQEFILKKLADVGLRKVKEITSKLDEVSGVSGNAPGPTRSKQSLRPSPTPEKAARRKKKLAELSRKRNRR